MELPNFMFLWRTLRQDDEFFSFSELAYSCFRTDLTPENLPTFDNLNVMEC